MQKSFSQGFGGKGERLVRAKPSLCKSAENAEVGMQSVEVLHGDRLSVREGCGGTLEMDKLKE